MHTAAVKLEFELAAEIRDEIENIKVNIPAENRKYYTFKIVCFLSLRSTIFSKEDF